MKISFKDIFPASGYRQPVLSYWTVVLLGLAETLLFCLHDKSSAGIPVPVGMLNFVLYVASLPLMARVLFRLSGGLARYSFWLTTIYALLPATFAAIYNPAPLMPGMAVVTLLMWLGLRRTVTSCGTAAAVFCGIVALSVALGFIAPETFGFSMPDGPKMQTQLIWWEATVNPIFVTAEVPVVLFWEKTLYPGFGQLFLFLGIGLIWVVWKQRRNPAAWLLWTVPTFIMLADLYGHQTAWTAPLAPAVPAIFMLAMAMTRNLVFRLRPLP